MQNFLLILSILLFSGCATTFIKQSGPVDVALEGSKFSYFILKSESNSKVRRLELRHLDKTYSGSLGKMSFKERHLKVFGLAAKLIPKGCDDKLESLGNIVLSKDPEKDPNDLQKEHPQYFVWDFNCK